MDKQIDYDLEGLRKIQNGVNALANVVRSTLGPGGTNVIIEKQSFNIVTKDGVTVAREVNLADPVENVGAQIVKEAATKTVQTVGDGTTTATVLAQAIFNAGLKNIGAGAARMDLKLGIDMAVKAVVEELKNLAQPVEDG